MCNQFKFLGWIYQPSAYQQLNCASIFFKTEKKKMRCAQWIANIGREKKITSIRWNHLKASLNATILIVPQAFSARLFFYWPKWHRLCKSCAWPQLYQANRKNNLIFIKQQNASQQQIQCLHGIKEYMRS